MYIQFTSLSNIYKNKLINKSLKINNNENIKEPQNSISFTSGRYDFFLKKMTGINCAYSGVPMLTSKQVDSFSKQTPELSGERLVKTLKKHTEHLSGSYKRVATRFIKKAQQEPEKPAFMLIQDLAYECKERHEQRQKNIYKQMRQPQYITIKNPKEINRAQIIELCKSVSKADLSEYAQKIVKETIKPFENNKCFSISKFKESLIKTKYKQFKRKNICYQFNLNDKKVINELILQIEKLCNPKNLEKTVKVGPIALSTQTYNLLDNTLKYYENMQEFSIKKLKYNLLQIKERSLLSKNDKKVMQKIIDLSYKLPSSSNSADAFIVKNAHKTPDIFFKNLIRSIEISAEHIKPRHPENKEDTKGKNNSTNFLAVSSRINSMRKNEDFKSYIKRNPKVQENIKKYFIRTNDVINKHIIKTGLLDKEESYYKNIKEIAQEEKELKARLGKLKRKSIKIENDHRRFNKMNDYLEKVSKTIKIESGNQLNIKPLPKLVPEYIEA